MKMVHQSWVGLLCLDVVLLTACSGGVDLPQESAVEDRAHDIAGTEGDGPEAQEPDELARLQLPLRAACETAGPNGSNCGAGAFCGGIAGIACSAGLTCVDDPRDGCEPRAGGADCGGLCVDRSDPCAAVRCLPGNECQARGDQVRCVPIDDPCTLVRCMAGTECRSLGDEVRCVPIADPCALVRCVAGTVCESNGDRARCV